MLLFDAVHPFLQYGGTIAPINPVANNAVSFWINVRFCLQFVFICVHHHCQIATPEHNFFVITGPNMGGKTIYMKMIATLQIMAQLGCYVPATSAQFRLCNKLLTRIGFDDEMGASTFDVEVRDGLEMFFFFFKFSKGFIIFFRCVKWTLSSRMQQPTA